MFTSISRDRFHVFVFCFTIYGIFRKAKGNNLASVSRVMAGLDLCFLSSLLQMLDGNETSTFFYFHLLGNYLIPFLFVSTMLVVSIGSLNL